MKGEKTVFLAIMKAKNMFWKISVSCKLYYPCTINIGLYNLLIDRDVDRILAWEGEKKTKFPHPLKSTFCAFPPP